ncbi:MAG: protein tyrosine phosphatase [Akkermansiaceae bacterium]|nr:protein tyrosine phosphatase [Akkermansiaceae bacterium]
MKTLVRLLALGAALTVVACSESASSKTQVAASVDTARAEPVSARHVENFHRICKDLYRSGQPDDEEGFSEVEALGIRSVLNLREYHNDTDDARHTRLHLMAYPVAAGKVTEADVENCLRLLQHAPKPVLVHCWHGSDRTGIIVAAYRIVYQGWSVDAAEKEFTDDTYGHHEFWYGNLVKLLRSTEWDAMRERLQQQH